MLIARTLSFCFLSLALFGFTGCVGPMAHGPLGGCCGPEVASDHSSCTGCGELYVDPWINEPANCVDPCDMCGNHNGQSCGKCRPMFEGIGSLWGYRCGDDCGDCGDPGCAVSCGGGFLGGDACGCGAELCGGACGVASCGCDGGCAGSCDSGCGCNSCGGGDVISGDVLYSDNGGQVIHDGVVNGQVIDGGEYIVEGAPTPTPAQVPQRVGNAKPAVQQPYKPERTRKIFNPRPRVATGDDRSVGY